jgi:hypothetical protein
MMAEGRQRHDWSLISALMTLLANVHRDPRKHRAFRPRDFDPFSSPSKRASAPRVPITVLKDVFIEGRMPTQVQEMAVESAAAP